MSNNIMHWKQKMVELRGIEPRTPCLQSRCSPSWATAPFLELLTHFLKWTHWPIISRLDQCCVYRGGSEEVYLDTRRSNQRRETQDWWVWVDSNHRPHPYQGCALTNWATDPVSLFFLSLLPNNLWGRFQKQVINTIFKGGDPAPGSPRATLLRLHPSHESHRGDRHPEG